ncbi:MAG: hypothetical protein JNK82_20975 [Myxococcaceae bacterium]|nr:hypothetical protein [Myxococcaceae bacterium]
MRTALVAAALAVAGCTHPVLLKKYVATAPKQAGIEGRALYVAPFTDRRVDEWSDDKSVPLPEPKGFARRELTGEQADAWEDERDALEVSLPKEQWHRVGTKRNGFGMPIQDVHSVTPPADWLTQAARLSLEAQGAKLSGSPGDADLVVEAVLRHAWLDLYVATWVHLVLDVTTTPRGGQPKTVRIHASEGMTAWTGDSRESYEIFSATEQRLERYLVEHVAKQLAAQPVTSTPLPP